MKKFKLLVLPLLLSMLFCSTIFWGLDGVSNVDDTISSDTELAGYADVCEKLSAQNPEEFTKKIKTIIENVQNFFSSLNSSNESTLATAKVSVKRIFTLLEAAGTPEQRLSFTAARFFKTESNALKNFFNVVANNYPQYAPTAYHLANVYLVIEKYNPAALSGLQAQIKSSSAEEVETTLRTLQEKAQELADKSIEQKEKKTQALLFKRELKAALFSLDHLLRQGESLVPRGHHQISFFNPIGHNLSLVKKQINDLRYDAELYGTSQSDSSGSEGEKETGSNAPSEPTGFEDAAQQAITLFSQVKEDADGKASPQTDPLFKKLDGLVAHLVQFYDQIAYVTEKNDEALSKLQRASLIVDKIDLKKLSESSGENPTSKNDEQKKKYLETLKTQLKTVLEKAPIIYAQKIKKFDPGAASALEKNDNAGSPEKITSGKNIQEIKERLFAAQAYCFKGEKKDDVTFDSTEGRKKFFDTLGKDVSANLPYDENERNRVLDWLKRQKRQSPVELPNPIYVKRRTAPLPASSSGGKKASDVHVPETRTEIITEGTVEEEAEVVVHYFTPVITKKTFSSGETPASSGSSGSSTGDAGKTMSTPSAGLSTGETSSLKPILLSQVSYHDRLMELIQELYERDMHTEIYLENVHMQKELADELNIFFTRLAKKYEKYQIKDQEFARSLIENYYRRLFIKIGSYAGTMPLIDILRGLYTAQAQPEEVVEHADVSSCETINDLKVMVSTLGDWYKFQCGAISKLEYIKLLAPTVLFIGLMITGYEIYASTAKSFAEKLIGIQGANGNLPALAGYLQTSSSALSLVMTGASLVSAEVILLPLMLWGMVVGYLARPYLMMAVKQLRGMLVSDDNDGWYAFTIDTTLNMLSVVAIGWLTQITSQFAVSAYNEYTKEEQPFALEDPNDQCLAPIIRESSGDVHHDIKTADGYLAEVNARITKLTSLKDDPSLSEFQKAGAQEELKAYEAMKTDADAYRTTLHLQAHEQAKENLSYRIARRRAEQERIAQESWKERERLIEQYNNRQDRFALLQEEQNKIASESNEEIKQQLEAEINLIGKELEELNKARQNLDTELFNDPKLKAVAEAQNNLKEKLKAAREAQEDAKKAAEEAAKKAAEEAKKAAEEAAKKAAQEADDAARSKAELEYRRARELENRFFFNESPFLRNMAHFGKVTANTGGTPVYMNINNYHPHEREGLAKDAFIDKFFGNKGHVRVGIDSGTPEDRAFELIHQRLVDNAFTDAYGNVIGGKVIEQNGKKFFEIFFEKDFIDNSTSSYLLSQARSKLSVDKLTDLNKDTGNPWWLEVAGRSHVGN